VHRGTYLPRRPPGDMNRTADNVYDRPFTPTPAGSLFGGRNEFVRSMDSETSQYPKDTQTEKDELPLVDPNRITRKVVEKLEEMYASNVVANLRNSGQFRQSYFPSLFPSQSYSTWAPGISYNKERERPDIFGFRAEVCKNCLSLNCFNVLYPTAEGGGYTLESSHRCDPNRIATVKNTHDKSNWMNERSKEAPGLLKEKIIKSIMFLNDLVAIKLSNPPPQIITIPNPNNPQRPLSIGKTLQIRSELNLNNNDYNSWAWKAVNLGPIGLKDWEVAEFLQIVNGATFAVMEVHHRSQAQQSATSFYFMYLANSLSTDFESLFRNQNNSTAKDSWATLDGINGFNVNDAGMGANGQDNRGHLDGSFYDNIIGLMYEGRVCENCLDSYPSVYYYRKDEPNQTKHGTEHQCYPKRLLVAQSVPNKNEMIAYYRAKLPEVICKIIKTQNQLLAFKLSVCPPNSIEIFPSGPNYYLARAIRAGQTILNEEEKLDFLHRTGSSTCGYFKVHLAQEKETREYTTLPHLIAIQVDKQH
jgi:hypothetical protein